MDDLKTIYFQGKNPEEIFQFYFRQHWIRMVWPFTRMCLFTLLFFAMGWSLFFWIGQDQASSRHVMLILLLSFFVLTQFSFLHRFYCYFLSLVIVTDRKVHRIKKNLFSLDTHQIIDLWSLQDLKKSQRGLIQNLFGFGSIILEAQDTQLRLHFCPHITQHYEALLHLLELTRRDRTEPGNKMSGKGSASWM